jgi:Zinc finger, C3HC4 type (RING finger)
MNLHSTESTRMGPNHQLETEMGNYHNTDQPVLATQYNNHDGANIASTNISTITAPETAYKSKVTRQTANFIWSVRANLVILSIALAISYYCVASDSDPHLFVLIIAPLELMVAFLKIRKILRRADLPSKKQKIFRVFTSSQILDAISISLAAILFYTVKLISSFKYTFCSGPLVLAMIVTFIKSVLTKRENESETFGIIFISVFRVFLNLQAANFFLKMDGFVEFSWKEAYWPFWIFFSVMIGLSFSVFLIMLTKICAFLIFRKEHSELMTLLWLFYFIDGFTVMICLFVIFSQNYLMLGEKSQFLMTIAVFIGYTLIGIGFSSLVEKSFVDFMMSMAIEEDPVQDAVSNTAQLEAGDGHQIQEKKEKKPIEIPEFLFKYSSTFFKTASKKDILFKKLFSQSKDVKKPSGTVSDRFKKSDEIENKDSKQGKTMKKTDLSMINFHLEVKGNDELMKHYRSMSYHRASSPDGNKLSESNLQMGEATLKTADEVSTPKVHRSTSSNLNESVANLCSVCFASEPDSVYMKCGHGGVCYECAIDIWKSTSECYLCREQIEQILQVEPQKDEKGNEYLKVVASTQLVDDDEVEADNSKVEYIN